MNTKSDTHSKSNMQQESNIANLANTFFLDSINKESCISFSEDMCLSDNIDIQEEEAEWESLSLLPDMYISTHGDTLQRILAELLTNAGKYSHPATMVILRVEQILGEIIFSVTNEGGGIPPEEQELIFEKFHRAQTAVKQAIPGTGLGLALVKPLVKHLRGKITVISSPKSKSAKAESSLDKPLDKPQGWITCFTVKLPQFLDGGTV